MNRKLVFFMLSILIMGSCQHGSQKKNNEESCPTNQSVEASLSKEIPFTIAKNYFAKNNVEGLIEAHINTSAQFDSLFGMATVMGSNGKPTPIDFEKQSVIAIIYPVTNTADELKPISLNQLSNGELSFTYQLDKGEKISYSIHPSLILIIDNHLDSKVLFKK